MIRDHETAPNGLRHILPFLIAALAGCATNPSVVQDGLDGYRVAVTGKTHDTPTTALQSEAQTQASRFCTGRNFLLQIRNFDIKPALQASDKPEVTLKFRCVSHPERVK